MPAKVIYLTWWKKLYRYAPVVLLLPVLNVIQSSIRLKNHGVIMTRGVPPVPAPMCARAVLATAWKPNASASTSLSINPECPDVEARKSMGIDERWQQTGVYPQESHDRITIAYIYYQKPTLLAQQLDVISKWPQEVRQHYEILIIDDCSPVGWRAQDLLHNDGASASLIIQEMLRSMPLTVYRIEPDLHWNIGGARNLAMHLATTSHVLLMDMDVMIPAQLASYLVNKWNQYKIETTAATADGASFNKNDVILHMLPRTGEYKTRPHPGVIFSSKTAYWRIGGCDEEFVGTYGHTDPQIRYRAKVTAGVELVSVFKLATAEKKRLSPLQEVIRRRDVCPASFTTCAGCRMPDMLPFALPPKAGHINEELFELKKLGQVPWSNEYLRFSWSRVNLSESCSL